MWIAKNKKTGAEYQITPELKEAYEKDPHLAGRYTFRPDTTAKKAASTPAAKPANTIATGPIEAKKVVTNTTANPLTGVAEPEQ